MTQTLWNSVEFCRAIHVENLRHQGSSQSLEEKSDRSSHRRNVTAQTADKGKETSDESNCAEEERNQVESEHESAQVVVLVRANELLRDTGLSAKVTRRVEWECWDRSATVCIQSILLSTDGEEGPSRRIARVRDTIRGGFEEVEFIQRCAVDTSSQDSEDLEEDTTSDKDERQDGENWS